MTDLSKKIEIETCKACHAKKIKKVDYLVEGKYVLLNCESCGMSFLELNDVDDENFDDYWNEINEYIYTQPATVSELTAKYKYYFEQLTELPNRKHLDVGSGAGVCVYVAQDLGFAAVGIEPSPRGVELSQKNYSIDIVCGLLTDKSELDRDFGVVTLWDVIEHVVEPEVIVNNCVSHLTKGGYLVLETPDEGAFIRRFIKVIADIGLLGDPRKNLYYRAHRFYFTRSAMTQLLERCGLMNIRFYKQRTMYGKALLKSSLYGKVSPIKRTFLQAIYWLLNKLPLTHNKMVVIAEKPR